VLSPALLDRLAARLTAHRRERLEAVLARRTRHLTLVLEDIYQPHNAAAVLRSCDGFGVQDVHVIENLNSFHPHRSSVSMGTERWLTVRRYRAPSLPMESESGESPRTPPAAPNAPRPATTTALTELRARGYSLAALTLQGSPVDLADVPLDRPLALLIGTELHGLSDTAHAFADLPVRLPMEGFAQSFNLSVCAAICLYELTRRLRDPRAKLPWPLPANEKDALYSDWLRRDVPGADELIARWTQNP
jgi:tRNA (guanosine-2'-O-)-methyltransferase